jgi:hypothetical protein
MFFYARNDGLTVRKLQLARRTFFDSTPNYNFYRIKQYSKHLPGHKDWSIISFVALLSTNLTSGEPPSSSSPHPPLSPGTCQIL